MWSCKMFAVAYINKSVAFKGHMRSHLSDSGVFFSPSSAGLSGEAKCWEKLQPAEFGLKLSACNKSKICHSTTDKPELIYERRNEPLSLPDSSISVNGTFIFSRVWGYILFYTCVDI